MKSLGTYIWVFLLLFGEVWAQRISLSQEVYLAYSEIPLAEALDVLSQKYGLSFSYGNDALPLTEKVALQAKGESLEQFLNQFLDDSHIAYKKIGNQWVLRPQDDPVEKPKVFTQVVRGTVRDIDTHIPLPGASIYFPGLEIGTLADSKGNFRLAAVPVGRHDLAVSYLGYKDKQIHIVLHSAKQEVLTVELIESPWEMESVIITKDKDQLLHENEVSPISARSFTVEETKRFAGSVENPAFMVTAYAGVRGGDDPAQNEIVIRGNMPRLLQWQLEGIEVPSPNHFAEEGTGIGAISMLSSNMLTNSHFFTGAFSSEYGNAISGVFDFKLRNGNNKEQEHSLGVSVLGTDISSEGPLKIGNKASYLVNYRYSTLDILNSVGIEVVKDEVPRYQDLAFKVHIPTRNWGTLDLFGLGGHSRSLSETSHFSRYLQEEITWNTDFISHSGVLAAKHYWPLNDRLLFINSLALSGNKIGESDQMKRLGRPFEEFELEDFRTRNLKSIHSLNFKASTRHFFKAGIISTRIHYDFLSEYAESPDSLENKTKEIDRRGKTSTFQAYLNWRFQISDSWSMNAGLHHMSFGLNRRKTLEPRMNLKWKLNSRQYLSAGFGWHSQRQALSTYLVQREDLGVGVYFPNADLDFIKSKHFVIGFNQRLFEHLHLKIEGYYQRLFHIPVLDYRQTDAYDNQFPGSFINLEDDYVIQDLISEGDAQNYGLEMTIERSFTDAYYFLLTAALFQSKYATFSPEYVNTRFNGNYICNLLGGKEFSLGPNTQLSANFRTVLAGGKRYTPIDLAASQKARYTVRDWSNPFSSRAKTYFRTDASIGVRINQKDISHEMKLDVRNITNRSHEDWRFYDLDTQQIQVEYAGRILPVFSYKIFF